jgi:hypothetical protein
VERVGIGFTAVYLGLLVLAGSSTYTPQFRAYASWSSLLFVVAIVAWCSIHPASSFEGQVSFAADRETYQRVWWLTDTRDLNPRGGRIEAGYAALVLLFRPLVPYPVFLAVCNVLVVLAYYLLMTRQGLVRLRPFGMLVLLASFVFWSGALNVSRQFLAAGFMLTALAVWKRERPWWSVGLMLAAGLIHTSAMIGLGVLAALYFIRRPERAIPIIWAVNIAIFAVNLLGSSPLVPLAEALQLQRYLDLTDYSYSLGRNRLDFAAISMAVMATYIIPKDRGRMAPIALVYSVLVIPFFAFSFLPFSDRLSFFAWTLAPVMFAAFLETLRQPNNVSVVQLVAAAACVLQVSIGIYGYSPRFSF